MRTKSHAVLTLLLIVFSLVVTSGARSPRRNRNRAKARNADLSAEPEEDGVCDLEVTCPGRRNSPVIYPIKGPARRQARESSGKEKQKEKSKPDIRAAFFVGRQEEFGPVDKDTDLVFDRVITNVGGGYNNVTGRFTAPVDGTYVFSSTIAAKSRSRVSVALTHAGRRVMFIWADSLPLWGTSTGTAILNMRNGEQAWIVLLQKASNLFGYMYSTFSGYCLYQGV